MRRAQDVKSAKTRATIAIQHVLRDKCNLRSFDACFECFDGADVILDVLDRIPDSKELQAAIQRNARYLPGLWLQAVEQLEKE